MVFRNAGFINTFFLLLRSGMYGIPVPESELPESIDWKAVLTLAQQHAVVGTIINSVQFLPERLRPSASTSAKMNKFALGLIQANMVLDRTAARLVEFLERQGISGVLLKGQGVARYYPMPQIRQTGDIDFYVGRAQYRKAVEVCKENLIKDIGACVEDQQHFGLYMETIWIELHRIASKLYSPFLRKRFQNWIVEELEQAPTRRTLNICNTTVTLPSYDFDAIYIFYHAWCHFIMGGIGLRQLCDWAMVFHSHGADIDIVKLTSNIRRFGLIKGWKLFACIAVHYLGVAADKMPLYDPAFSRKSEIVLEEILEGGNFGYYSKAYRQACRHKSGFKHTLNTVYNLTMYFISLFPLMPIEAIFLYINNLGLGVKSVINRSVEYIHRKSNHPMNGI